MTWHTDKSAVLHSGIRISGQGVYTSHGNRNYRKHTITRNQAAMIAEWADALNEVFQQLDRQFHPLKLQKI